MSVVGWRRAVPHNCDALSMHSSLGLFGAPGSRGARAGNSAATTGWPWARSRDERLTTGLRMGSGGHVAGRGKGPPSPATHEVGGTGLTGLAADARDGQRPAYPNGLGPRRLSSRHSHLRRGC